MFKFAMVDQLINGVRVVRILMCAQTWKSNRYLLYSCFELPIAQLGFSVRALWYQNVICHPNMNHWCPSTYHPQRRSSMRDLPYSFAYRDRWSNNCRATYVRAHLHQESRKVDAITQSTMLNLILTMAQGAWRKCFFSMVHWLDICQLDIHW